MPDGSSRGLGVTLTVANVKAEGKETIYVCLWLVAVKSDGKETIYVCQMRVAVLLV